MSSQSEGIAAVAQASDSSTSDEVALGQADVPESPRYHWGLNAALFFLTAVSLLSTHAGYAETWSAHLRLMLGADAILYAGPLLAILVAHELGHYFAARLHRVPASLPFFIPFPWMSPFGTLGAVILMSGRIRSRNALLDIGAAGPIAGLVVAVPVLIIGLVLSEVAPHSAGPYIQEGNSLLYLALKWAVHGTIPATHDVFLHPMAFAGWVGLLLTALNLVPLGQLDGGHIAFALLGQKQNRLSKAVVWLPLAVALYNAWAFLPAPVIKAYSQGYQALTDADWAAVGPVAPWIVMFVLFQIMAIRGMSGHPPFEPGPLTRGRRLVALGMLATLILIFTPSPLVAYLG